MPFYNSSLRSIASQRIDDHRSSFRTDGKSSVRDRRGGGSSIIGSSVSVTGGESIRCSHQPAYNTAAHAFHEEEDSVDRANNTVQAQIERMFTDVIKDASACSFPVRCLGSLPLKDKVTSLYGLQDPLRQLYLSGAGHGVRKTKHLRAIR